MLMVNVFHTNYFSQGPTEAERKIEELTRQLEEEMEKQEEEGEYFGKKKFAYTMFIHSSQKTEAHVSYFYAIMSYSRHVLLNVNLNYRFQMLFGVIYNFFCFSFILVIKERKIKKTMIADSHGRPE